MSTRCRNWVVSSPHRNCRDSMDHQAFPCVTITNVTKGSRARSLHQTWSVGADEVVQYK